MWQSKCHKVENFKAAEKELCECFVFRSPVYHLSFAFTIHFPIYTYLCLFVIRRCLRPDFFSLSSYFANFRFFRAFCHSMCCISLSLCRARSSFTWNGKSGKQSTSTTKNKLKVKKQQQQQHNFNNWQHRNER